MDLSCGGKFLKFLVFFFNAIVFIGGAILTGFGIYLLVEASKTEGTVSQVLPACILVFGILIFLLGFLGCFGACYNNTCMLKTFAILVGILLVAEIICGILLLVYRHQFVDWVGDGMQKAIQSAVQSNTVDSDPSVQAIIKLQKQLQCCGGRGPSDWANAIPPSCCGQDTGVCNTAYGVGCAQTMYNKIKDSALGMGITILVICLIQIGAIICACCLASKVNEYEQV